MRCDCCPLCPIAEDEVCLESEGKYGIEHKDGMLGCKHPRNWCEKRSDEHDIALGEMGTDMGIEMSLTKGELKKAIELCKHMIGLENSKPYRRHGKVFYKAYRNFFAAPSTGDEVLEKLPSFIISKRRTETSVVYVLTAEGISWLGRQLQMHIKEI